MAGRSFTRHSNGIGNRIRAEHINELQVALEEDDSRIDLKTDDGQFVAHTSNTNNPHGVTKAQVGLGNVDNTSDADKPVSTAQQAALDGKADVEDAVPAGGVYGQVLTVTHSGREWVDPPGIVYPSLLLSPDGSFDKAGAVSPTIVGSVSVVQGQYGQAWRMSGASGMVEAPGVSTPSGSVATIFIRGMFGDYAGSGIQYLYRHVTSFPRRISFGRSSDSVGHLFNGSGASTFPPPESNVPFSAAIRLDGTGVSIYRSGGSKWGPAPQAGGTGEATSPIQLGGGSNESLVTVESVLILLQPAPDAEIVRIMSLPGPWTMQNTAVNMALQSQPPATPTGASLLAYFPPNRKIAAGGATLRTAPGPSTQAITTLAAGTDVHDTKQTVSVSSVSYSLVVTAFGNAWVPTSTLV